MKRGEVWTVASGPGYARKPRPVAIVQDDSFDATDSITVCPMTTDPIPAPHVRVAVQPNERNGLKSVSMLMVDKVTTAPRSKLGSKIGELQDEDIVRLNRAMIVFLGLANSATR